MTTERKIYLVCLIGTGLLTLLSVFLAFGSWNMGVPPSLMASLLLSIAAGSLTVSIAWRAFQGVRPTPRDPAMIALDLLTPVGLILIFITLWEIRR
ncbi:MAG TPA: hypothetical protein VF647_12560 [Longimicrobium sp.]